MSSDDRRREEKERLWNEVMGSRRNNDKPTYSDIKLTTDTESDSSARKPASNALLSANKAMEELGRILNKQKKELAELTNEIRNQPRLDPEAMYADAQKKAAADSDLDLDALAKEIEKDYGVETPVVEEKKFDSKQVFSEVETYLNERVYGQAEAEKKLAAAFRRPYVMGTEEGKAKNVILVYGPKGTGKRESVASVVKALNEKQIFASGSVYTIDMSRYTSGAQEQIFLQDLYEAISGKGSVICFENFESSFPGYLRMVDSLATTGSVVLNKRYVLSKGVLVENQTGLVKDAVDTLSVEGKYLVFITEGKLSSVQDAFGAGFMRHVLDQIQFASLTEESAAAVIEREAAGFAKKCTGLELNVEITDELKKWIASSYDKSKGAESIQALFNDFYISLSQAVLNESLGGGEKVTATVSDGQPRAVIGTEGVALTREKNSSAEIAAIEKELDEIVGLDPVKNYIRSLQSHIAIQERRKAQGMKSADVSKHMIFTGNPGTGKTTIARLISRYMKAIGALTEGQLVEVTRADLVAQYVGQTAPLTMSVIRSAIGGVLFIDEAYALYRGKDDSFGLEAIDTLVKAMEDNRSNLIVILAGYKKEMAGFLESNSGLRSRFPNLINFDDYTGEQLLKIAKIQAKSKGYEISPDADEDLLKYFDQVQSINAAEAGNGRLARNTIEEAVLKQANRLVSDPDASLTELRKEDFDFTIRVQAPKEEDTTTLEDLMKLASGK